MATPSSRSKGRIRSDAMGPTSQRSRLRSQQRFSSSSMTPVPWVACCKQRRYGDRSPASYTSIRSTTFAESHPALLTRNALEARFRFSIGLRGVAARDVLKNHFRMFNFIQTPIVNGCTLLAIEQLSQAAVARRLGFQFNLLTGTHPGVRALAPKHVGRKETPCKCL